jgi:hypothetical protein
MLLQEQHLLLQSCNENVSTYTSSLCEATLVYPSVESHLHPITHILAILLLFI